MKILITAGGTIEKIDEVRHITNSSTGALGRAIAESFLRLWQLEKMIYVCGRSALLPSVDGRVEIRRVDGVDSLQKTLSQVMSEERLDGIVHCMAVSDYATHVVTNTQSVACAFADQLSQLDQASAHFEQDVEALVRQCLTRKTSLAESGKISSDVDDLIVVLKKTPKIIHMFKKTQPQATLVGFKLLNHVPLAVLLEAGSALMQKNDCDFVLANDLADITPDRHRGFLIKKDGQYDELSSREEIADRIAQEILYKNMNQSG